jgi:carboxylesterase
MPKTFTDTASTTNRKIMPGAEPIYIDQGRTGLLFFHGFTGSPYEGRPFAQHFSQKGYGVWVPLLPGHGTNPDELLTTSYKDWLNFAEQEYQRMTQQYETVIVCGQSMGGALALHVAAKFPVKGLVTLAAAIHLNNWRTRILPLVGFFRKYRYKVSGPDIADQKARAESASYTYYPTASVIEFMRLIRHVETELPAVTAPTLLFHALEDHVIPYRTMDYIKKNIASKYIRTVTLRKSYHVISVDYEKELIFSEIEHFINQQIFVKST